MVLPFLKPTFPVIPDYELREKIGKGGAGAVYKARHQMTGQQVAIKVIPTGTAQDGALLRRFEQEFQAASQLTHPNIVQVIEFGRDQTDAYLVMEYVDGITLARQIKRSGPLAEQVAVRIITQVAQALQFAHERGLVHRDVKPDNILLRQDGQAKLADFGLVKDLLVDSNLTEPLSTLGTPQFMAPEQYQNPQAVDARADIYSLAATLYMAVTGTLPFGSCKSYTALMGKVLRGTVTPPRDLLPALSAEVDAAIRRGMNPDPEKRLSSCLELVHCLKPKTRKANLAKPQSSGAACHRSIERRASLRYSSGMGTICVVNASVHDNADAMKDTWPATLEDVSRTGLGLVLGRRLERNTVLTLELTTSGKDAPTLLFARVIRVQAKGFGHWFIGCRFLEPLSDEDLQAMLEPASPATTTT
jgi:serine/threonine protein kinase